MRVCGARMGADRIILLRNFKGWIVALLGQRHAIASERTLHARFTICTRI